MKLHFFATGFLVAALASACSSSSGSSGPPLNEGGAGNGGATTSDTGGTPTGGSSNPGSGGSTSAGSGGATTGTGGTAAAGGTAGAPSSGGTPGAGGAADLGPYPAGPYGNQVGNTLIDLQLQGYVATTADVISNTLTFTTAYSLDDVRKSGKPYALIHVSEFYCPGCQHAARELGAQGKTITDEGVFVMDILSSKLGAPTTKADLDAWITTANETTSAFIDAPSAPTAALQAAGIRETAIIIQIPTMKIVWILHGDVTGATPPSIVAAEAELHTLLGK